MLRLDIAWLTGTAFLARDPSSARPDWPPEPDRIFSALVASWGAGGELETERQALEWLEALEPPLLSVDTIAGDRSAPTVFVPPNDPADVTVLPEKRKRQPRRFPAVPLDVCAETHMRLFWTEEPAQNDLDALNDLAFRTSYIGHSSSLVRCRFVRSDEQAPIVQPSRRAPYSGRLAELRALHERHITGDERARPRPSQRAGRNTVEPASREGLSAKAANWLVFEHYEGERPDLRAAAIVCDTLRIALMEAWTKAHDETAPGWIAGHKSDGSPASESHMAIVPMANVGWRHSDGSLMGLAIVPPKSVTLDWNMPGPQAFRHRQAFQRTVGALLEPASDGENVLSLGAQGGSQLWNWRLKPSTSIKNSLNPRRYLQVSRTWASTTPVLLDRHLKNTGRKALDEAQEIVAQSCDLIGLPEPSSVTIGKYSAIAGSPPAWPPGGVPAWQNWSRKKSFGQRRLYHVQLVFPVPVQGPVLIGAGRFAGLGLCLPMGDPQ